MSGLLETPLFLQQWLIFQAFVEEFDAATLANMMTEAGTKLALDLGGIGQHNSEDLPGRIIGSVGHTLDYL